MKWIGILLITLTISCNMSAQNQSTEKFPLQKTEEEWKNDLSDMEYYVLRQKGTERAFTGEFEKHYKDGVYSCAGCGNVLFDSETKYDSGSGWPAFYDVAKKNGAVKEVLDKSHGMLRREVVCANCGGHLGHVFDDGPRDKTGQRYCVNSISLDFKERE